MLVRATTFRDSIAVDVTTVKDAAEAGQRGVGRIPWGALGPSGEQTLLAHGVSVRCLQRADGAVPDSDDEESLVAIVARAYQTRPGCANEAQTAIGVVCTSAISQLPRSRTSTNV